MFKLRDYQQEAVDSVLRYFIKHGSKSGNPAIALPTGTGKSLVIAGLIDTIMRNWGNTRILVLTHVKELIEQNHDKFVKLCPHRRAGIYSAGLRRKDKNHMITFAGIQSIRNAVGAFKDVDLIIVDECDLISPTQTTSYQKFFEGIRKYNEHLKIVGLSATLWRLGYGSIVKDELEPNAMFDKVVFNACTMECFNWFIKEGYLVPVVPKATKREYDVSGVGKRGGEFIEKELQKVVNDPQVTEILVEDIINIAREDNRQSWLIFCAGVDHSNDVRDVIRSHGITCETITGDTPSALRDKYIEDFKNGRLQCITNNNVLTTGFDHPGLDLIGVLRPSDSSRLWVQILGRGTRPDYADGFDLTTTAGRLAAISASHKQNCLVLDYSGNTRRLGPINDPVIPKRPGQKGKGEAPVKQCPTCKSWNHASARYCGGLPRIDITNSTEYDLSVLRLRGYSAFVGGSAYVRNYCGGEFKFEKKLMAAASTKQIIKNDLPVTEVYKVDMVSYYAHYNRGDRTKPPTLRVDYNCGSQVISQYVCLFHDKFAGRKAREWWRQHCNLELPSTIDEALNVVSQLKVPTHIYVDISKKWPEVLNSCYDGSAFGTKDPVEEKPEVKIVSGKAEFKVGGVYVNQYDEDDDAKPQAVTVPQDFDDDIPF